MVLRQTEGGDRAGFIDLHVSAEVGRYLGGASGTRPRRSEPRWTGRRAHAGEPVVLCTQSANTASVRLAQRLGFVEVERFEEFGAEQWFGSWSGLMPSD
ncbi:MAG: hypothetical protein WKF83_06160 [Nocardioidaceae bacterium]